jgi:transposase
MQHPHAAGIDIGSRSHWVCVGFTTDAASCLIREFPAHPAGLKALAAFLRAHPVNTIALESTGIYWIALYELLQAEGFEVLLVDPSYSHQLRGVPRRTAGTASGSTGCLASACWGRPFGPTSRPARYGPTGGSGPT